MDVSTGSRDAVEDVGKGDCYTAETAMLDTGKSFFTAPGEVAFCEMFVWGSLGAEGGLS